ncbi:MAG: hypothetical protein AB8B97_12590 [Granulosicoccus sp.]
MSEFHPRNSNHQTLILNADTTTVRYSKAWLTAEMLGAFLIGYWIANWLFASIEATDDADRLSGFVFGFGIISLALLVRYFWRKLRTLLTSDASITLDYKAIQLGNGTSLDLSIDWHDIKQIEPVFAGIMLDNRFTSIDIHLKQHKRGSYEILNDSRRKRIANMAITPFLLSPERISVELNSLTISADALYHCIQKHVDAFNKSQSSGQSGALQDKFSITPSAHSDVESQGNSDDSYSLIDMVRLTEQSLYQVIQLPYRLALAIDVVLALTLITGLTLIGIYELDKNITLASPAAIQLSGYVKLAIMMLFVLQTVNAWPAQINRRSRNAVHRVLLKAHGFKRFGWFGILVHMFVVSIFLNISINAIFNHTLPTVTLSS